MSEINKEGLEARLERLRLRTSKALDERVKATLAGAGADAGAEESPKKGRTVMYRMLRTVGGKLSLAAAGVVIAAGLACYLIGTRSVAFADVLEKTCSSHIVRYTSIVLPLPASSPAKELQIIVTDDGKQRVTMSSGVVMINDFSQGKGIVLDPKEKLAVVLSAVGRKEGAAPMRFLEEMKSLRAASYENLGNKEIDGKSTKGFRSRKEGSDWTIWFDEQTELPVRVEHSYGGMNEVMSNFVFNEPVDEALFSLTPPEGYKIRTETLDASVPTEKDVIDGLRAAAVLMGGEFPTEFSMAAVTKKMADLKSKGFKPDNSGRTPEERAKAIMPLMRAFIFIGKLKPENDWHYAAEGVKVGDASKALCWWRPDGSKTYRVVYGDFSVRDCNPSDLPTPPAK
jgi:hypothetical protein